MIRVSYWTIHGRKVGDNKEFLLPGGRLTRHGVVALVNITPRRRDTAALGASSGVSKRRSILSSFLVRFNLSIKRERDGLTVEVCINLLSLDCSCKKCAKHNCWDFVI